jgi:hypothetical protein
LTASVVFQRDDGQFQIGLSGSIGPFPTRPFAEAIAKEVLNEAS